MSDQCRAGDGGSRVALRPRACTRCDASPVAPSSAPSRPGRTAVTGRSRVSTSTKRSVQQPVILEVGEKGEHRLRRCGNDALRRDRAFALTAAASSASSSSTTSPSSRTSASRVVRRRALRDDRNRSARARRVTAGSPATGIDLERGADAQQQVRAGAQRVRLLHRLLGQHLAEQHDVRLHRPHRSRSARRRRSSNIAVHLLERDRSSQHSQHEPVSIVPCTSITRRDPALRCSVSMFCVIDGLEHAPRPRARRARGAQRSAACPRACRSAAGSRTRSAPGRCRKTSMCATSIGSTFSHRPVPGERKSGMPAGHGDAGAGQRDGAARRADQLREALELHRVRQSAFATANAPSTFP